MKHKLLIATNNNGKVKELQELLGDNTFELITPAQLNLSLEVLEDGNTYAENAIKKAVAFAQAGNLLSIADDSGLEVDVLNGAPGLYSARYSPKPNASDADRRAYLLENLRNQPRPWTARFRATIAIASPDGKNEVTEATCEGLIIPEERGTAGFGYDPIFLLPSLKKTMAELEANEKNRLSHRGQAVLKAKPILLKILNRRS